MWHDGGWCQERLRDALRQSVECEASVRVVSTSMHGACACDALTGAGMRDACMSRAATLGVRPSNSVRVAGVAVNNYSYS